MQTNRTRFHRALDFIGFFAFHTATNIVGGCIFGSRQPSLRKDRAYPRYRVAPLARQSLTRFERKRGSDHNGGVKVVGLGTDHRLSLAQNPVLLAGQIAILLASCNRDVARLRKRRQVTGTPS